MAAPSADERGPRQLRWHIHDLLTGGLQRLGHTASQSAGASTAH